MRILVTGATGFVGKHLCRRLEAAGHLVFAPAARQSNRYGFPDCEQIIDKMDQIWHLAAWTQAGNFCLDHTGEQWEINQRINLAAVASWRHLQPQAKFVSFGTSCAYDPHLPLIEKNYLEGRPIDDLMSYAMCKRMLQVGVEAMGKQYGMKWLTIVPSTIYGPGYHKDGRQLHFIYDLARKIIEAKRTGVPPVLWGDGHQMRELIHVDELIPSALWLAEHEEGIFNIPGHQGSIGEFAKHICEIVGYDNKLVRFDETAYVGAKSKLLDPKKGRIIPNYYVPLMDGLRGIVEEMRA